MLPYQAPLIRRDNIQKVCILTGTIMIGLPVTARTVSAEYGSGVVRVRSTSAGQPDRPTAEPHSSQQFLMTATMRREIAIQ
jgi:hypothetical protein